MKKLTVRITVSLLAVCLLAAQVAVMNMTKSKVISASEYSPVPASIVKDGNSWTLENGVMSAEVAFEDGSLNLKRLINKELGKDLLDGQRSSTLFKYTVEGEGAVSRKPFIWYSMNNISDKVVTDDSGNGNNAEIEINYEDVEQVIGIDGMALQFLGKDRSDLFCNTGRNETVKQLTYSAWINLSALNTTGEEICIVSTDGWINNDGNIGYATNRFVIDANNRLSFYVGSASKITADTAFMTADIGKWHHIAVTFDAEAGMQKLYLNGSLIKSQSYENTEVGTKVNLLRIGTIFDSTRVYGFFNGKIDDFKIYTEVLNAGEIEQESKSYTLRPDLYYSFDNIDDNINTSEGWLYVVRDDASDYENNWIVREMNRDDVPVVKGVSGDGVSFLGKDRSDLGTWYDVVQQGYDNTEMTYTMFVNLTALNSTDRDIGIVQSGTNENNGTRAGNRLVLTPDNKLKFYLFGNKEVISDYQFRETDIGEWVHIAVTYDKATKSEKIYVNGVLSGSVVIDNSMNTSITNLRIGTIFDGAEVYGCLSAKFDEFRVYRKVLKDDEIQKLAKPWDVRASEAAATDKSLFSDDGGWILEDVQISDIKFYQDGEHDDIAFGKKAEFTIRRSSSNDPRLTVKAVFEIYNDLSGIRFYTYLKNNSDEKMLIKESTVFSINAPDDYDMMYYVWPKTKWNHTKNGIKVKDNTIVRYADDKGYGLTVSVENNFATSIEKGGFNGDADNPFMWLHAYNDAERNIKVLTNPTAVQLNLFPGEELEYFSVNLTVFTGDDLDAKMSIAEHYRNRFKFINTTHTITINDWEWFAGGNRTYDKYINTYLPLAKRMGVDELHVDDLWNVNQTEKDKNSTIPIPEFCPGGVDQLISMSEQIRDAGLKLGIWYSPMGGNSWGPLDAGGGYDIADPEFYAKKWKMIEDDMIGKYDISWTQFDLGVLWKEDTETSYSSPSDSVFRKTFALRRLMDTMTAKYPEVMVQTTPELDNTLNQGVSLIQQPTNGIYGTYDRCDFTAAIQNQFSTFGLLPMEGSLVFQYINTYKGGVDQLYSFLTGRHTSIYDPLNDNFFPEEKIERLSLFNEWRKSSGIQSLLNEIMRPVDFGGEDVSGPYSWMYVNREKTEALLLACGNASSFTSKLRWLDENKTYVIQDISLDNDNRFHYANKGTFTGAQLKQEGFKIELSESIGKGKAYYIAEVTGADTQLLYADAKAANLTFSETASGMTVKVEGKPGDSIDVFVYKSVSKGIEQKTAVLDNSGRAALVFDKITSNLANRIPVYKSYLNVDFSDSSFWGLTASSGSLSGDWGTYNADVTGFTLTRGTAGNYAVISSCEIDIDFDKAKTISYDVSGITGAWNIKYVKDGITKAIFETDQTGDKSGTIKLSDLGLEGQGTIQLQLAVIGGSSDEPASAKFKRIELGAIFGEYAPMTGAVFSYGGEWPGEGNSYTNAFDGSFATFFDCKLSYGGYVGVDLGDGNQSVVKGIAFCPRGPQPGWDMGPSRMVGGKFQGSNSKDSGYVDLYTITEIPESGKYNIIELNNKASYRYLRYIGPELGYCNIAELVFLTKPETPEEPEPTPTVSPTAAPPQTATEVPAGTISPSTSSKAPKPTGEANSGTGDNSLLISLFGILLLLSAGTTAFISFKRKINRNQLN